MNFEEKTIKTERKFTGSIINVDLLTVELPNGKQATRDVVLHSGASVIVPITQEGEIYLVKQYRKPCDIVSIEIPAGKLDENEDPLECAKRELKEETGIVANKITKVLTYHTAPAFSNEVLYMYLAEELSFGESCPDEDEFITSEKYKIEDALKMIFTGEITDGKTIIGILIGEKAYNNQL